MENKCEKGKAKSTSRLFFTGVFILTISNVLVKAVGLISKIVLNRVVGSIGAGYYSSAYEIYAYLYVISTAGLPVALSILVSRCRARGRFKEAKKIFDISFVVFLVIGLIFSSLMIAFSDKIASFIGAPQTSLCIISIAPTMLFVCLSSCMRGYFQGYQLMQPTGTSQLIEAACKVGIGVAFAFFAKKQGYSDYVIAAYTILGVTIGVLLGMIYLYIKKLFFKEQSYNLEYSQHECKDVRSRKELLKELFKIAIPITLSSSVLSLTTIIDTLMVQNRLLSTGMNEISVRVYYGDYTSLVISMFNLPTIFFYPIANALVPLISATREEGDEGKSEKIRTLSLRVITLISMPCAIGLGIFSYPILDLLMFKQSSVERAAPWLSVASVSVLFLGIIAATNTFLNASGKQKLPIISMIAGATAKLVSNYFLLGKVGMYGAPISTVICYICAATLNVYFVLKYVGRLPSIIKIFGLPFLISILSIGSAVGIFILTGRIIPQKIATIVSIVLAIVLYVVLLFVFKGITKEDLHAIPGGNKAIKILKKLKIPIK